MLIDLIRSYLSENRETIAADGVQIAGLRRLVAAEKARLTFLRADPRLSQGFLRVERVASGEPVALWGSDVPSHAFNRIEIFAGRDDPESGKRLPGERLVSMLLTEGDLTNLIMRQNRGDNDVCVTLESAGTFDLGPFEGEADDPRGGMEGNLQDTRDSFEARVPAIAERLRGARLPLSAKLIGELVRDLGATDMSQNFSYHIESYHEVLSKKLVALQIEATHTALNASRIMAAREALRLAPPEPVQSASEERLAAERLVNPVLNACAGYYDPSEIEALLPVLEWRFARLGPELGMAEIDPSTIGPHGRHLKSHVQRVKPSLTEEVDWLCSLHNRLTNPHVRAAESARSPRMLTVSTSLVSGSRHGLHSEFGRVGHDLLTFRVATAGRDEDHGRSRVREVRQIVELRLTPEEFMLAVRGHPSGEPVRCDISWALGGVVDCIDYVSDADLEIDRSASDMKAEAKESRRMAKDIAARIRAGVSNRSERDAILGDLAAMERTVRREADSIMEKARIGADSAEDLLRDQYQRNTQSIIAAALPGEAELLPRLGG